jgi:hypothetical protein
VGLGEVSDDHFINAPARIVSWVLWQMVWRGHSCPRNAERNFTLWFHQIAHRGSACLKITTQPEQGHGYRFGLRSSQADDADAAAAGRGCDSDNSVIKVHGIRTQRSSETAILQQLRLVPRPSWSASMKLLLTCLSEAVCILPGEVRKALGGTCLGRLDEWFV